MLGLVLGNALQREPHLAVGGTDPWTPAAVLNEPVDYARDVRPVLDRRCVVCHGCYDAPCQLKLSSIEGIRRGASQERIYEPKRIGEMQPTRLFIDEKSTSAWRGRGFTPVLNEGAKGAEANLADSVLYRLLRLKREHPQPASGRLPASFTLGLNREESCPTPGTVADFARDHPLWGMPYAMPGLPDREYQTLVAWLAQGAPAPTDTGPSAGVRPQIAHWEGFLNGTSNKQRLVSRYLYEHLFHAHIHFAGSPEREFYRLVRSTTPPGQPVDEIPTVLPFDDPGPRFHYRLVRYTPSIVIKNHIVYEFSDPRMQRLRALFLTPDYEVRELPGYDPDIVANPFKVFAAIPAASRYRFLLDDAHFFIEGFIKGPVCRGQIALNVIEDRFWVLFFDPNQPVITHQAQFIGEVANELRVPADVGSSGLDILRIWTDYWRGQRHYMERKQDWFRSIGRHDLDRAMQYIWDGNGSNPNAALTVFRHFDSGSVAYGLVGAPPETAWIIDYPLFERIHYLLVAGFNVYGNIGHRLSTRIYMDFLRMEGEDYFLAFLPADRRKAIRDSWYLGQRRAVEELFQAPDDWLRTEIVTGYRTDDPQRELYDHIRRRLAAILPAGLAMNRCGRADCRDAPPGPAIAAKADRAMQAISRLRGKNLHAFPDVAFVRVRTGSGAEDLMYSLIRDKAYKNVTSFLADERERDRADIEQDRMTVVDWLEGSYPNFFFSVPLEEIDDFARRCAAIRNEQDYEQFVERYGMRRTNPGFWALADGFQDALARQQPVGAGLFDLNRYQNH